MKGKDRDPQITHKIMSSIPSKDTEPELILRRALWKRNLRYRINYRQLPGKPDIVFTKYRIAVFCDGDFWHGHNWALRGMCSFEEELSSYSEFWRAKISKNVEHDKAISSALEATGWLVIRVWESDIRKDPDGCVERIIATIEARKKN